MKNRYEHLFECTFPVLGPETLWYRHPKYPLWVSNNGVLYDSAEEPGFYTKNLVWISNRKEKIVYEAFLDTFLSRGYRVYQKNNNPYDLRMDNLTIYETPSEIKEARKVEKKFIENTMKEMDNRLKNIPSNIPYIYYFQLIGVPVKFLMHYYIHKEHKKITLGDFEHLLYNKQELGLPGRSSKPKKEFSETELENEFLEELVFAEF